MPAAPETLNRLLEAAAERIEPESRVLFERFAACLLRGFESHHLGGESVLVAMAVEAFDWIRERPAGECRVRVRNPEDRPGHTVIEVHQDDRPFIVDTLRIELRRASVQERIVIHPLVPVERDAEGRLLRVLDAENGIPFESYVYIECVPSLEDPGERARLERSVRQVMEWVIDVTDDHRRMILSIREVMANLEYAGPALPGGVERTAKIQRFLDWTVSGRFVLVGLRRYRLSLMDGVMEAQIVPGTGLGMWRNDASSRLFEPRRGSDIPSDLREDLEDPRVIVITKSHMESRIHRHGRLDRIMIKEHDDRGRVTGFTIIVGLFTQRVLRTPGSQIPLLSERLFQLLEERRIAHGSHRHQAFVTAFDSIPVELLIGATVPGIGNLVEELIEASGTMSVRLVLRESPHGRFLYAAVLIPREHYREDLRVGIRRLLEERTGAGYIDDRTSFLGEGTAIVHCFCTSAQDQRVTADRQSLEEAIRDLCSPWEDQLLHALREGRGEEQARELAVRYETGFAESLRVVTHPVDAVRDVEALEALLRTGQPQFALFFDHGDAERETATLRIYLREAPLLSDVLPATQHFGIQVVDAQLSPVEPLGSDEVFVESLRILPLGADQDDLDVLRPRLGEALARTLDGRIESDALNGLVLGAGLDWRQVDVLRALLEYFVQIQGTLSRPYLRSVLLENPLAVRVLVHYFEARHDPSLAEDERERREEFLRETFDTYRDRIKALNEDRALQGFMNLIEAVLRTNFFAPETEPHHVVFKLDAKAVRELSGVVPYREIFVHSSELLGIHLRGGPVARGGLRWSDRHDDLRIEILGLMNTQMLKNGLIVPVGAKGGFVLRHGGASSIEDRRKADEQYRVFVASLLDVTDNLAPDGSVIPPPRVHRRDGDDPYLVVAADKGTAHLSDAANEIAVARDFWLGDAFASGGSQGYDHKKYGITARGAWECVKHHFAELAVDPDVDSYTVVGIGDMSGDVFGNGMLLARRAKLVAAFDHRHVFLDPDPDPDVSWKERQRLFELPRSSWDDYARELISEGGGVWPRGSKSIPVPLAMREALGIDSAAVSGNELIRAILGMEVDLLWNGGIGTYVKSSKQSHDEAGDRANDAVRIDADQLRARVVGEGGNLGLTQEARVEAALRGIRLNTDAIDNSGGVDLSDHEVNYKVALAPLVRSGKLDARARSEMLFEVADEACESVLSHNRAQALCLSLDELRARREPGSFLRTATALCERAQIDAGELELPDPAAIADRRTKGQSFTRPELAVLVGLAKMQAQAELSESELLSSPYLDSLYHGYFPERFQRELPEALAAHRLRPEITALRIVNRLVDAGGVTLFDSLTTELGVGVGEAAAALIQAEDLLRAPELREQLLGDMGGARDGVYRALIEFDAGVRGVARFLARSGVSDLDGERILRWRSALDVLSGALMDYLSEGEKVRYQGRLEQLLQDGLPAALAELLAALPLADRGLNIIRICERVPLDPIDVARTYARLGDRTGINWVYAHLSQAPVESVWDSVAVGDLRWDLLDLQQHITADVLGSVTAPEELPGAIEAFLQRHGRELERVQELQRSAAASASPTTLNVITARLRSLRSDD